MTVFALTCPRSLTGRPGSIPQKTYRAISGATRTRQFGTVAVGATIEAEFITDEAGAEAVLDNWRDTRDGILPITLPAGLFTNHTYLSSLLPAGNEWHMSTEPSFEPILAGRATVRVSFESRLEV